MLLLLLAAQAQTDPRVCALRERSAMGLRDMCETATNGSSTCGGLDAEAMRSVIYEKMQRETTGATEVQPWPGPGAPHECHAEMMARLASATPPEATPQPSDDSDTATMLFQKLDRNKDGKLTRAEMQSTVANLNAAAKAKGEPEHDLFRTFDQDNDGFVSKDEAEEAIASIVEERAAAAWRGRLAAATAVVAAPLTMTAMAAAVRRLSAARAAVGRAATTTPPAHRAIALRAAAAARAASARLRVDLCTVRFGHGF